MLLRVHSSGVDDGKLREKPHLRESSQSRRDVEYAALAWRVAFFDDLERLRPRADNGHFAAQDIQDLRQLIDFEQAQNGAGRKHPRIFFGGEGAGDVGTDRACVRNLSS